MLPRFQSWLLLRFGFIALFLGAVSASEDLHAATATIRLGRDSLIVGEVTRLQVVIEGATPQQVVSFPTLTGVNLNYVGVGQEFTSQNGHNTQRYILNYNVTATRRGSYTMPSVEVKTDKGVLSVADFSINVVENDFAGKPAFLKLIAPRAEVYVGELFPVEMLLYVTQAENIDAPQLKNDGFVIGKQLPHTKGQSQIGNQLYNTFSFKLTVAAAKAGELTLGPAETRLTLLIPSANQDFFMSRYERRSTELTSEPITMKVLPLPLANKPASFSGAIGQYSITREATPTTVSAGDPVTLKYAVRGEGSLETLSLPAANWRDFKVYDPNSSFTPADSVGLKGVKIFEQVVIPEHSQIKEIPPLDFSYFDPQSRQYQTISLDAIPLEVKSSMTAGGTLASIATTNGAPPAPERPRDIVHIKNEIGPLAASVVFYQKPWFWGLQAIPVVAFLALFGWKKREDALANNPALRRQIELKHDFQNDLKDLRQLSGSAESERFFTIAYRLLQTWLALKIGSTPGGITESVVDDLAGRGLPLSDVDLLHQLFQTCNHAKYAPGSRGTEHGPVLSTLENLGRNLDPLPKSK